MEVKNKLHFVLDLASEHDSEIMIEVESMDGDTLSLFLFMDCMLTRSRGSTSE